jgi:hypothetical protein
MVSYKPIRLDSEDLPNILPIKMITVMCIGITALEKKEMALCGGKNAWGDYCRMPVYYSKTNPFEMWFLVCAVQKSIWKASLPTLTSVPNAER